MIKRRTRNRSGSHPVWLTGLVLLIGLTTALRAQDTPLEILDNDTSPYHLALLAYKGGHYQEALDALNRSTTGLPPGQEARTLILKSRILTELHQYNDGEKLLRGLLTQPEWSLEAQIALGDLLLRKRDFDGASSFYSLALQAKPEDPDLTLKTIYARIGANDLVSATKLASQLKPFDPTKDPFDPKHPGNPAYYFAKAALAQTIGKSQDADDDIETARTLYGTITTSRYLKAYFQFFNTSDNNSTPTSRAEPPPINAPTKQTNP